MFMSPFVEIPKRYHSRIYDACLALVADPSQPIAVRCFSMTVAQRLAAGRPALLNELRLVVGKNASNMTPGLRVRANRLTGTDNEMNSYDVDQR